MLPPVEQPMQFKLVINLKTAKVLGNTMLPPLRSVLRIYRAKSKAFSKSPAPSLTPGSGSSANRRVMNLIIDVVSYCV
jgi:hypothetical protein